MAALWSGMIVDELALFTSNIGRDLLKEPGMARKKKVPAAVEPVQAYIEGVAKNLVDRIYGPQGLPWGTKLTELEDVVIAVRDALSEKMLAQALERQAQTAEQRPDPFQKCSGCAGPVEDKPDPEPRNVQTRAGEAEWDEPHCYCRKCRQAFFPSEQEPGHRSR
jgi:hypothetical protein